MNFVETVIIGGGQAGLATSYYLKKEGREHIIFDKAPHAASAWRDGRWDSFTLVTPNWTLRMPGRSEVEDRNGYMPKADIVKYFENYISEFNLPVKYNTEVSSVEMADEGFVVHAGDDFYTAKNVVAATGVFQKPRVPKFASRISSRIFQITNAKYKNPGQLPGGGVLVVGSGQSGCQIAEELSRNGRKVFLATGCTSGRVPRHYRGKDIIEWLEMIGFFNLTFDQLPPGAGRFDANPHLSGTMGGHTINLHRFVKEGIRLLGHLRGADDRRIYASPDLYMNLTKIDAFEERVKTNIDNFVLKTGLDAPAEELDILKDGYNEPVLEVVDLELENIRSVIWACGYNFDFSFIKLPVHDKSGYPIQNNGITGYPGLYFVGLPWMPNIRSGILIGFAEYAKDIAYRIFDPGKNMKTAV